MSALPKGDTGTTTEYESRGKMGFSSVRNSFHSVGSISALDAPDSPVTVFEFCFSGFLSSLLQSVHFCMQKSTCYRAQLNSTHSYLTQDAQ